MNIIDSKTLGRNTLRCIQQMTEHEQQFNKIGYVYIYKYIYSYTYATQHTSGSSMQNRSNEKFPSVAEWLPNPATRPDVLSPPSRSDQTRRRTCWPLDRADDDGRRGAWVGRLHVRICLSTMKNGLTLSDKLDNLIKRCMSSCHSSQCFLHSSSWFDRSGSTCGRLWLRTHTYTSPLASQER